MLDVQTIVIRLLLAAVLGGIVGAERERHDWAAGLRTHMLVCVGAALAIIVSAWGFEDALRNPGVILDPSRIAAQVISGIGFLGAGTILFLQRKNVIRGLTTAAGLWAVASIGLAAGSGMYAAAGIATVIVWVVLALLKPFEQRVFAPRRGPQASLLLQVRGADTLSKLERELRERSLPLDKLVVQPGADGMDQITVQFSRRVDAAQLGDLGDALRQKHALEVKRIDLTPGR